MPLESSLEELIACIQHSNPLNEDQYTYLATQGIIDYFAASLQARHHPELEKIQTWITQEGGVQRAWLIGQSDNATARQAAIFNGFQAHLLDYDDVHENVRGHPSAVILSALFASLADGDVMCRRFLSAYIIGIEVMARLGEAVGNQHYQKGWHNTSTLGGIAATAAICYLHQYPFIRDALAIAATQASGLRLLFGTSIKPLHAGIAAQTAIQACQWAKVGFDVPCNTLDPQKGFLAVYGEQNSRLELTNWGNPWRIHSPGLWFKCYSFCSAAAYIADATSEIIEHHNFSITDITAITVIFSSQSDAALIYKQVEKHEQGRFSAEYLVASLLLKRELTFDTFNDQSIDEPLKYLMGKIERQYDLSAPLRYAQVNIELNNQKIVTARIDTPKGSPANPYASSELKEKFIKAVNNGKTAQLAYNLLSNLHKQPSVKTFIKQFKQLVDAK